MWELLKQLTKTFLTNLRFGKLLEIFLTLYKVIDMFNFFSDIKKSIVEFRARIVNLENRVSLLFNHVSADKAAVEAAPAEVVKAVESIPSEVVNAIETGK